MWQISSAIFPSFFVFSVGWEKMVILAQIYLKAKKRKTMLRNHRRDESRYVWHHILDDIFVDIYGKEGRLIEVGSYYRKWNNIHHSKGVSR